MVKPANLVAAYIDPTNGTVYADEGLSNLTLVGQLVTSGTFSNGGLVHGSTAELGEDDHPHYSLVDGTRDFTGNVSTTASTPTDVDHLTRKDYVDSVAGGGGGGGGTVSNALTGVDGITLISGSNLDTISGSRSEFVSISGSLQNQIDSNTTGISDNTTFIVTTSGYLQTQIDSVDSDIAAHTAITDAHHTRYTKDENDAIIAGTNVTVVSGSNTITINSAGGGNISNALVGSDGITVTSGSPTDTISGFYTEFVAASGFISDHGNLTGLSDDDHPLYVIEDGTRGFSATVSGVDPVDSDDLATKNYVDTELVTVSGHLQSEINAVEGSDVDSINTVTGTLTLAGSDGVFIINETIDSDTPILTVSGFRTEFVSASGSLQSAIDATVSNTATNTLDIANIETPGFVVGDGSVTVTSGIGLVTVSGFVGTSGSLIFSDGVNLTESPDKLYYDIENDRMGFGTSSPQARFHTESDSESLVSLVIGLNVGEDDTGSTVLFRNVNSVGENRITGGIASFATGTLGRNGLLTLGGANQFAGPVLSTIYLDSNSNCGINTSEFGGGSGVLSIGEADANPSSNPTAAGILYVDITTGELRYRSKNGTITVVGSG